MRLSHVTTDLTATDLADLLHDFVDSDRISFDTITESGIKGQVRFLVWNIDFVAQPSCSDDGEVSVNISAHKLVPIPPGIVERSLREAVKDAPSGIEVLQQALKLNVASLLAPLGIGVSIRQLRTYDGFLRIALANLKLPAAHDLSTTLKARRNTSGVRVEGGRAGSAAAAEAVERGSSRAGQGDSASLAASSGSDAGRLERRWEQ